MLPSAQRLAGSRHVLFGGDPAVVSGDTIPALFTIEPDINIDSNVFSFGTLYFSINISGPLEAVSVVFNIDGTVIDAEIDTKNPILEIDVSQYSDGDHFVGVRAVDALGIELYRQFNINFTNINPLINVTSSTITNQDDFTATGTFDNWRQLTRIGPEFLIPLASETLNAEWHQATFSDEHFIRVEVSDQANNKTESMFSFRIDINVPEFSIETIRALIAYTRFLSH